MPPTTTSILQPLEQPPDLFAMMRLCGVRDFNGALGALHWCPLCHGRPPKISEKDNPRGRMESLRVYLTTSNEILVRCHRCGLAGTALDLYRARSGLPWSQVTENLRKARVFGDNPAPEAWIRRTQRWEKFAALFETTKGIFRHRMRQGKIDKLVFGEVGLGSAIQLERNLPGVRLVSRWGKTNMFLIELRRSIHGHPVQAVIRHGRLGHTVAFFDLQPPEPLQLMVPEWALFRDWGGEMILFSDPRLAGQLHEMVSNPPEGEGPPLAWIADCHGPLIDDIPCRTARYIPSPEEGPELALAFAQAGVEALVKSEDAVETIAEDVVTRNPDPAGAVAYLQAILQKRWIAPAVAKRLTEAVAAKLGEAAPALIARSGATDRVLPCTIRGTIYLCRQGIYVKKRRRGNGDWEPATNFSLRIEESRAREDGRVMHHILLLMEHGSTSFDISDQDLQAGRRLRERAAASAVWAGFAELPQVFDSVDLKRLPAILQATQLKPPLRTELPAARGFVDGRFYGPNFITTATGANFRSVAPASNKQPTWILPETAWEPSDRHLSSRANEFVTWLGDLDDRTSRMVGAVLHAALAWLHRGSRGLPSCLLLPSEAHLDLLGRLTGLVPIDVGRGPRERPGLPRLMRSAYWKPDQFQRHGRIVAALEDQHRKISGQIPIVIHSWTEERLPDPPAGILSLLTHACLGTRNVADAAEKLASLVECPNLRDGFRSLLEVGARYLAAPEGYLDAFLSAVASLPDVDRYILQARGRNLLKREVVARLNQDHDLHFRETRLIEELRERFPFPQPARYGREQVPVFRLPEEAFTTA